MYNMKLTIVESALQKDWSEYAFWHKEYQLFMRFVADDGKQFAYIFRKKNKDNKEWIDNVEEKIVELEKSTNEAKQTTNKKKNATKIPP